MSSRLSVSNSSSSFGLFGKRDSEDEEEFVDVDDSRCKEASKDNSAAELVVEEKQKEHKKAEKIKTRINTKSPFKILSNNGRSKRYEEDNGVKSSENTIEDFLQTVATNQYAKRKRSRSKKHLQFETCDIATL